MSTMKAWQFHGASGSIEKTLVQPEGGVPRPMPTATEVLVEVSSTTLNPIDFKILELGTISKLIFRKPVTPGLDVCGRVVEVGSNVSSFHVGDLVFGCVDGVFGNGALAEFVQVSQDKLALVPEGLNPDDLGAITTVGLTTYQAMKPFVKPGDRVFINGGSGGTGVLAIQIAKALHLHVTTSCSTGNIELCKSLGADEVLDYKTSSVVTQLESLGKPFNLIVDNVGNPSNLYRASNKFLAKDGAFVQVGLGMDFSALKQFLGNMLLPGYLGGGRAKYVFAITKPNAVDLKQLASWMEAGKVKSVVDSVWAFEDAREAFARLKTGRARGKVVVRVKKA
ncbi:reticulon-4-interacting protein 1, mitochondrial precursor [Paraphoma chrysanthemicola]|uniref:Reticulon-4-interacting protein 1, mitochondrial n=1 Tax=Paraphoma chrysanthemicola TaxID=798071 RepID=A0A8K0W2C6_9PLEO|nr:reticulon-4-interacting protein 1, mitochondrial precursor [Paraphoma chrysanthemicola]